MVYAPVAAVPCNLSTHTCLQSDVEELRDLPDASDAVTYYYAFAVDGPCPRRVGLWQQIIDSEDYFLMALSTVHQFPDPYNTSQLADLIIFEDFTTHFTALSFCPSDLSQPTLICISHVVCVITCIRCVRDMFNTCLTGMLSDISLERQSVTATSLLLRVTSNPVNFVTLPLDLAAGTNYDMGHLMLRTNPIYFFLLLWRNFRSSSLTPYFMLLIMPCTSRTEHVAMRTPDTVFLPCDRFYGGSFCTAEGVEALAQGVLAPVPPYNVTNVLNPPWPWLWVTKRSGTVVDGSTRMQVFEY